MTVEKSPSKSFTIGYVVVKLLYFYGIEHELAVAKSYGFKSSVKLGGYKKKSKLPCWGGLQKNHAQLLFFK